MVSSKPNSGVYTTSFAQTVGQTHYPSNLSGGATTTAGSSVFANRAKRTCVIHSITVRGNTNAARFALQPHSTATQLHLASTNVVGTSQPYPNLNIRSKDGWKMVNTGDAGDVTVTWSIESDSADPANKYYPDPHFRD